MNFNDTTKIKSVFCESLTDVYNNYIEKSIGIFGFITNLCCILVFIKIVRLQKSDIYKYLLYKSILDAYICLRITFKSILNCQDCIVEHFFTLKVIYLVFFIYIFYAVEFISIYCQIVSCFNRYRVVTFHFKILEKITYKIVLASITCYSLLFYIYQLFDNKIVLSQKMNSTKDMFSITNSNLGEASFVFGYIHTFMKDFVGLISILVLNILTLYSVRHSLSKKKLIVSIKRSNKDNEKAELRLTVMVMATSVILFIAYGLSIIKWLKIPVLQTNKCFITLAYIIYWLSFTVNFFFYYYFNLNFKQIAFNFLKKQ